MGNVNYDAIFVNSLNKLIKYMRFQLYKISFLVLVIISFSFQLKSANVDSIVKYHIKNFTSESELKSKELIQTLLTIQIDSSIQYLKILEDFYKDKNSSMLLDLQCNITNQYKLGKKNDLFLRYYNSSMELARKIDSKSSICNLYLQKAEYFKTETILDSAIYYCIKSEDINNEINDPNMFTAIFHFLGDIYDYLELYVESEIYYNKVIDLKNSLGWNDWRKIVIYTNLGNIYSNLSRYNEAYYSYKVAESQILINSKNGSISNSNHQLLHVYKCLSEYFLKNNQIDSAKYYIDKSLLLQGIIGDINKQGDLFTVAGITYDRLGDYNQAKEYFDKANLLIDSNNYEHLVKCYLGISELYLHKGDFKSAYEYSVKYSKLYKTLREKNNSSRILQAKVVRDYNLFKEQIEQKSKTTIILVVFASLLFVIVVIIALYNHKLNHSYKYLVNKSLELSKKDKISDNYTSNSILESNQTDFPFNNGKIIENIDDSINLNIEDTEHEIKLTPELENMAIRINQFLDNTDILNNPDFNINNLADKLNTNRTYISKAINGYYKQSFHIYTNELRVKKIISLMSNPENHFEKIEILMNKVGFSNRPTFTRSFQKYTGVSPSTFFKNIKNKKNIVTK